MSVIETEECPGFATIRESLLYRLKRAKMGSSPSDLLQAIVHCQHYGISNEEICAIAHCHSDYLGKFLTDLKMWANKLAQYK